MFRATAASKYREDEYELLRSCGTKHGYSEEEIKEAFDCFQTIPATRVFVRKLQTNRDRKIHMDSLDTVFSLSDDTTRANYKPTIDFVALNEDPANVLESSCGNKNDQRTQPVHNIWQNVYGSETNRTIESAQGKPNDSNLRYVVIDGSNVAMK